MYTQAETSTTGGQCKKFADVEHVYGQQQQQHWQHTCSDDLPAQEGAVKEGANTAPAKQ